MRRIHTSIATAKTPVVSALTIVSTPTAVARIPTASRTFRHVDKPVSPSTPRKAKNTRTVKSSARNVPAISPRFNCTPWRRKLKRPSFKKSDSNFTFLSSPDTRPRSETIGFSDVSRSVLVVSRSTIVCSDNYPQKRDRKRIVSIQLINCRRQQGILWQSTE